MPAPDFAEEKFQLVDLRDVDGPTLQEAVVSDLATSISRLGILQPPMVTRAHGALHVVFGRHRIEAARRAGLTEIICKVAELNNLERQAAEIDENLCRKKLGAAEEAQLLQRRKALYEAVNGPAKTRGINAANKAMGNACANLAPAFTTDVATKTGKSPRSVQRAVARAEKLGDKILEEIKGTHLDCGKELDRIAQLGPEDRAAEAADAHAAGSDPTRKKPKKRPACPKPTNVDELRKLWKRASQQTRQAFAKWVLKADPKPWSAHGAGNPTGGATRQPPAA